ncbi:pyocin knob domain-containing protein, partial [Bilophila wadsworthia]|uniref:pyocin knob domain-containing protein n=1 Tax=Bilophila wadsworthia TaxID=35833 RepID=UPI0032BF26CE
VDVNASVDAAALSERNAHDSEEVAKRKAGEASGSAGAAKVSEDNAKVSETNALASKNAAALSAESAEADRIAAEAARDEAQDLANVGYASESRAGLAKVDGKTTQAAADGAITVKDVAIGGNLEDLASARGQIGDYRTKLPAGTDLNDIISSGTYIVYSGNCTNVPMNGMDGYYVLRVFGDATNPNAAVQKIYSRMGTAGPEWSRRRISDGTWQPWQQLVQTNYIGDGIKISRSKALADGTGGLCIISVPEMQGATISAAGTSGLVPPAAAGQQESFLTGGGEYKPALTKISDSVNLADS